MIVFLHIVHIKNRHLSKVSSHQHTPAALAAKNYSFVNQWWVLNTAVVRCCNVIRLLCMKTGTILF